MTRPEVQVDIKPAGMGSAIVYASFDDALGALTEKGYEVISLAQNARLRIQQGVNSYISENANGTREAFVYVPKKGVFLTKKSLIMENAREATQDHREGKDYSLTDMQVEQALVDSVKIEGEEIPTNRFSENEITDYAFGEIAEQYGQFLREAGINKMPIWLASLTDKPFERQMWFRSLFDGSVLYGDRKDLHDGLRLRGVKIGVEGTLQDLQGKGGYTLKQISNVLRDLGIGGLETQILSKLKQ